MSNFKQRILDKYSLLSVKNKKVGKFIIDNPQEIAMKSASQLGQEVGVSETTVIRFCYALGYSGFSELQNEVRNYLIFQKSSPQEYQTGKEDIANQPNFFVQSMQRDQAKIQEMIEQINNDDLFQTAKRLYESNNILITGIRTSFALAHWLTFTLNIIKGNATLIQPGMDDISHLLSKLDQQSTLIAITFHRYSSITIKLAELAKKQGSFVIGITDSPLSPLAEFSDILLPINLSSWLSTIESTPAVFSLLNAIVGGVSMINKEEFEKRKEIYNAFIPENFFM
ncbi:MurR/RpiR family transcriptional regulator [Neobacillus sp. NRS-1170]|uniref:MurR/RpiR family transcriptional regulator n=1 Tax=Neobacillus sp. NRS-1170 TaxID=3233898 RepID=UPI003D279507